MRIKVPVYLFIITLLMSACGSKTGGPQTWLDRPLDNSILPLAAQIIQAHASDITGIAKFEFYVDDALLSSVAGSGDRLSEASVEWTPPGPGNYTIKAMAINNQGSSGPATQVHVVVGGTAVPVKDTLTPASALPLCAIGDLVAPLLVSPPDGAMVASDPLLSWSYPDTTCHPHSYKIDISEDASFADISWGFGTLDFTETSRTWPLPAGQCYYWRASAYVPDSYGPVSAAWTFCIEATPTASLIPPTITAAPLLPTITSIPPTRTPTATSSPTPDISPPSFISASVNPDSILTESTGCSSYARTSIIQAQVQDSGGDLSSVWANWSLAGDSGQIILTSIGGNNYQGTIGPVNNTGTINITIFAQDLAGNIGQSNPLTINVQNCVQ